MKVFGSGLQLGQSDESLKHPCLRWNNDDDDDDSYYYRAFPACMSDCVSNIFTCSIVFNLGRKPRRLMLLLPLSDEETEKPRRCEITYAGSQSQYVAEGAITRSSAGWQSLHSSALCACPPWW